MITVAHDIANATRRGVRLIEGRLPVREPVRGGCEILGYDPLYLACKGRDAAIVGEIGEGRPEVVLETELGGERRLEELEDDPLPRIC